MISETRRFGLRPIPLSTSENEYGNCRPYRSRLTLDGAPTAVVLMGSLLQKQFVKGELAILISTVDCPYEEDLHLYVLGKDLRTLDYARLRSFDLAIFNLIEVTQSSIFFDFYHDEHVFEMQLLAQPQWTMRDFITTASMRYVRRRWAPLTRRYFVLRELERQGHALRLLRVW